MRMLIQSLIPSTVMLAAAATACSVGHAQVQSVSRATAWENLFKRSSGWSGADGIYSVPLNGLDAPGSVVPQTMFVFGDTFIGHVRPNGKRASDTVMVNNTAALLNGTQVDAAAISFYWGNPSGTPTALFVPNTPQSQPGDWYWFKDGAAIGSKLYFFASRMRSDPNQPPPFSFAVAGTALIVVDLVQSGANPAAMPAASTQLDTPFLYQPTDGRGLMAIGEALMLNTPAGGAIHPDGYLYVYGVQNDTNNKKLIAACVWPEEVEDFEAYSFWDGNNWVSGLEHATPLAQRVSSELSVTPLNTGDYVLVSQQDTLGRNTQLNFSPGPVGPFGAAQVVWTCPEPIGDPNIFCYNAKAHPHLSAPGTLLISYNVNSVSFSELMDDANIYRPRFIEVKLAEWRAGGTMPGD